MEERLIKSLLLTIINGFERQKSDPVRVDFSSDTILKEQLFLKDNDKISKLFK